MTDLDAETEFLGEWGRFQQQTFFLLCLTVIPNAFTALSIVFVADTPPHRCLVPAHVNLSAAWRNSSIPLEEDSHGGGPRPSRCSRYRLGDIRNFSDGGLLPGVDVNLSTVATEGCVDGWEYDRTTYDSTISSEWNLVCDEGWKKPMSSSVVFCGYLLGALVSGQVADRFGRKIVLVVSIGAHSVFATILAFSSSWTMFCVIYFIVALAHTSRTGSAFVLGTEILSTRVRKIFSTVGGNMFFCVGYMLLPLAAFFIRGWRMLLLALALPSFLLLTLWWCVTESPRWLLSQGRAEEAEAIVRDAAKKNQIEPPAVIFGPSHNECKPERRKAHNICDLLRTRNIRWISLTLWVIWNTLTVAYYALSLNTSNVHGNKYLNCFLSAAVEIPAYILSWIMFRWCSRRRSLFSTLFMGGLFLLLTLLVPANLVHVAVALEMMGKFAVTTAFSIMYAYTVEVYPTVLRNTALGACSMASRIGSIVAPYAIYLRSYSISLPYILIGSLTVLSGLLSLLLPESNGMPLPDTITHMQDFPGCCKKTPYKLTQTEENEPAAEGKCPVVS
ncbi:organic cation/carnitine transporter 2-like [Brachionichthys hirsutus]|uniref:organic cation/carnitine transporter 2-like n=1 Tax=Brachionichthys hirsutus TaxID=412623 RepID=UPI003604C4C3